MYPVWWLAGEDEDSDGDGEDSDESEEDSDSLGEDTDEEDSDDSPGMQMTCFKMSSMAIEVTFL